MAFFRILLRVPRLLFCFLWMPLYLRLKNRKHDLAFAARSTRIWAKAMAEILHVKITVKGKIPEKGGFLIAANHQGALDVLIHGSLFPLRFAPKKEIRYWPVFGFLTGANLPVWIDRTSPSAAKKSAADIKETLQSGINMIVYPEGTTSDGTNGLLPFKSTAFQAAVDSGAPVLPVLSVFAPECRSKVQWVGDMPFLTYVFGVLGLKEIPLTVYIMDEIGPEPGEDRKVLAERVYKIMDGTWRKL